MISVLPSATGKLPVSYIRLLFWYHTFICIFSGRVCCCLKFHCCIVCLHGNIVEMEGVIQHLPQPVALGRLWDNLGDLLQLEAEYDLAVQLLQRCLQLLFLEDGEYTVVHPEEGHGHQLVSHDLLEFWVT